MGRLLPVLRIKTLISVAALCCFSYTAIWWMYDYNPVGDIDHTRSGYLVDTPVCKIPKLDPFDETILNYVHKTEALTCPSNMSLTYHDGLHLRINWTAIRLSQHEGNIDHCKYTPVHRPKDIPKINTFWEYLNQSEPFNGSVAITHDFVRVDCFNNTGDKVYTNFHAFIQPNVTIDKDLKKIFHRHVKYVKEPLNVMLIGIDSVSRPNFLRQMVKTRKFLLKTMGAVDMMGYNKVGDNTLPNIVPMMLGKLLQETPYNDKTPFDNFNFIWKQYSNNGYRTLFAEDYPSGNAFEYSKAGFLKPPADYYYKPVALAMDSEPDLWSENHHCFQDRLEAEMVLDYTYQFIRTFKHDPHFAFTFITRDTHDYINGAGTVDETYYKFFKKLHDNDLIRNTIVFVFGDHGFRYGDIRRTFNGMMEERLPFMLVSVPRWLKTKYLHIQNNLNTNANRLSTHFDVYETMTNILYFNGSGVQQPGDKNARGISWFQEIPRERSCDQAGIHPHWCTCMGYEKLNVRDNIVHNVSKAILAELNDMLANYSTVCKPLTLSKINEATKRVESKEMEKLRRIQAGDKYQKFAYIQLVITTSPGHAMFDATARADAAQDSYEIAGDISRINKYGNQSDCIDDFRLKKFCYCR